MLNTSSAFGLYFAGPLEQPGESSMPGPQLKSLKLSPKGGHAPHLCHASVLHEKKTPGPRVRMYSMHAHVRASTCRHAPTHLCEVPVAYTPVQMSIRVVHATQVCMRTSRPMPVRRVKSKEAPKSTRREAESEAARDRVLAARSRTGWNGRR